MIYLAVDPGGTTGLAWLVAPDDADAYVFESRSMDDRFGTECFVHWACEMWVGELTVIAEKFEIRKNTHMLSNQEDARYILGAIEYICKTYGVPYHEQTAGQMKSFIHRPKPHDKVKQLGWYVPGPDHPNDAAGHLITYLALAPGQAGQWMREQLA